MQDKCKNCGEPYLDRCNAYHEFCKPCQINKLKRNFIHWTSGNEKIDLLIQEKQLSNYYYYLSDSNILVFEWIPYNQFKEFKEIDKDCHIALWEDGPKYYDYVEKKEYVRSSDEYVILKHLCNSENVTDEVLKEV